MTKLEDAKKLLSMIYAHNDSYGDSLSYSMAYSNVSSVVSAINQNRHIDAAIAYAKNAVANFAHEHNKPELVEAMNTLLVPDEVVSVGRIA